MQLHYYNEIEAADIQEFRECTGHKYDKIINDIGKTMGLLSDEDWDQELVYSVETVLNEAHPDKLVVGNYLEEEQFARWELYEIPDKLNNIVSQVLEKDLEDMPTLINSTLKPEQDLAKWRLKEGK